MPLTARAITSEQVRVAVVRQFQCPQVARPLGLGDDGRRVAALEEHEVEKQAPHAPVSIGEWVDALEPCVVNRGMHNWVPVV